MYSAMKILKDFHINIFLAIIDFQIKKNYPLCMFRLISIVRPKNMKNI